MNNSSLNETQDSQALLNKIVLEFMKEQKRRRLWRWIIRILLLIILLVLFFQLMATGKEGADSKKPHAGLVDIEGKISDDQASANAFSKSIEAAYNNKALQALIIRINSPGGSPVQADYMFNTIRSYRKAYPKIKVYAVCVDICTSAAYYVAAAADEIYANQASIVGSIGVIYNGFGFVDALQKLGVTRRLQTAGSNKGLLDAFLPINPVQEQFLQSLLNDIHQRFIEQVKKGRGSRLKIDDDTFSGLFWTGRLAKEKGLIDGFASSSHLTREILKLDTIIDYTSRQSMFDRLSKNFGEALASQFMQALGTHSGIRAELP